MDLKLNNATNILTKEAEHVTTDTIKKIKVIDDSKSVSAVVSIGEGFGPIKTLILWDDKTSVTYTAIGNWTDSDVDARIIEILTSN